MTYVLFDLEKKEYVKNIGTRVISGTKLYETTSVLKYAMPFSDKEKDSKSDSEISEKYGVSVKWEKLSNSQAHTVLKQREIKSIQKQVENYLLNASKKEAEDLLNAIFHEYNMESFYIDEHADDLLYYEE